VDACAAVTASQNAAALLRSIDAANLFLVALDDERSSFRYHHLVRRVLRAELRARDPAREQALQLRAAEWLEDTGDTRRAARHFLAAHQVTRALALLQDKVVPDFLHSPDLPAALDLSMIDTAPLEDAPDQLLGLAADLLVCGDTARGGEFLHLLDHFRGERFYRDDAHGVMLAHQHLGQHAGGEFICLVASRQAQYAAAWHVCAGEVDAGLGVVAGC